MFGTITLSDGVYDFLSGMLNIIIFIYLSCDMFKKRRVLFMKMYYHYTRLKFDLEFQWIDS